MAEKEEPKEVEEKHEISQHDTAVLREVRTEVAEGGHDEIEEEATFCQGMKNRKVGDASNCEVCYTNLKSNWRCYNSDALTSTYKVLQVGH